MNQRTRGWTLWILLIVLLLGSAYVIVERANPGLRGSSQRVSAGFGH